MTISIYGHPRSRTFRVLWVLAELDQPYELIQIAAADAAHDQRVTSRNPMGKIPVMEDDGLVLSESMVIDYYLARKSASALVPPGLAGECGVLQWTLWVTSEVERPLTLLFQHRVLFPAQRRDPAVAAAAEPELKRPFDALEAALAGRSWLVGDAFTLADLHVSVVMLMTRYLAMDMSAWPGVQAWLSRCTARPAFVTAEKLRG